MSNVKWVVYMKNISTSNILYDPKVFLPNSMLIHINANENIDYPLMFKVQNKENKKTTHCGVLQFTAEEGTIAMPFWVMCYSLVFYFTFKIFKDDQKSRPRRKRCCHDKNYFAYRRLKN